MKLKEWLETWKLTGLKIKTPYLDAEFKPSTEDQDAALNSVFNLTGLEEV